MFLRIITVVARMKSYIVMILQFMIWSGFTFIEWLSKHDQLVYKVIMFLIFFYLSFTIGRAIIKSTSKAFFVTSLSLFMYSSFHFTMAHYLH